MGIYQADDLAPVMTLHHPAGQWVSSLEVVAGVLHSATIGGELCRWARAGRAWSLQDEAQLPGYEYSHTADRDGLVFSWGVGVALGCTWTTCLARGMWRCLPGLA